MPARTFKAQAPTKQDRRRTGSWALARDKRLGWSRSHKLMLCLAESTEVAMRRAVSNPPRRWHARL